MKIRLSMALVLAALLAAAVAMARTPKTVAKTSTSASRLLLPYFEVDTVDPEGVTTFFSVRNQSTESVEVAIRYFEANRPAVPQLVETVTLGPRQVTTANLRFKNLIVDADGKARGYVYFEADGGSIQGDYFQLDEGENFAAGDRLVDADPASGHNDLCSQYTVRAFNGGAFDGGTVFTLFLDSSVPTGTGDPVAFYTVYNEAGGDPIFSAPLFSNALAFRVAAEDLGLLGFEVPNFGAIEFELQGVGHVWAQIDGLGRFSVGLAGSCGDAAPI